MEKCPDGEELLCESVRSYIINTLKPYYDYGQSGYVPPCHNPEFVVEWTADQFTIPSCARIQMGSGRDEATCSLGRIQVISRKSGDSKPFTTHATILGCMTLELLTFMKPYSDKQVCSILSANSTGSGYSHSLELENCPKISDFCNTVNFCIPPKESVVKPFRAQGKDSSFETGIIVAIVVVIFIIFVVLIMASVWKNPLKRSVNYSPAQVQATAITSIESSPSSSIVR